MPDGLHSLLAPLVDGSSVGGKVVVKALRICALDGHLHGSQLLRHRVVLVVGIVHQVCESMAFIMIRMPAVHASRSSCLS